MKKHNQLSNEIEVIDTIDIDTKLHKRKFKKNIKIVFTVLIIIILLTSGGLITNNILKEKKKEKELLNQQEKYDLIVSHYDNYVKTISETDLYLKENDNFNKKIKINTGVSLYLDDTVEDYQDEYFKIKDTDYYIHYSTVQKTSEFTINNRYKSYVVFDENVVTKDSYHLYDEEGNYLYELNNSASYPIWIKDDKGYYIEFLNQLVFIKKEDVKEVVKHENSNVKTTNKVITFCYHQIYKENEKCNGSVYTCIPYKNFESHLTYLKDNNYITLSMKELELFMDKKIQIPKNSVVITLDDGSRSQNAAELALKYQTNMTYFIITGTYDTTKLVHNNYIEYQSHTNNMHKNYRCPGGNQGGLLLCEKESVILKDLATSQEKLGGKEKVFAFAYPFYDFNDRAINLLKQQGFRLGFIGLYGTGGYTTQGTDKMKVRRRTVWGSHTLNNFIEFVSK